MKPSKKRSANFKKIVNEHSLKEKNIKTSFKDKDSKVINSCTPGKISQRTASLSISSGFDSWKKVVGEGLGEEKTITKIIDSYE